MLFESATFVAVHVVEIAADTEPNILTVQEGVGVVLSNKYATGNRILTKPVVPRSPFEFV